VSVESQSVVSVEEYGECCETETENALSAHERHAENKQGRGLRSAPQACWIRDDAYVREAYEASIAAIPATPGADF
jgi:hypothetical protein